MQDCNLYNTIRDHINSKSRFHMPGHSGNLPYELDSRYDFTELDWSDNLHSATGVIKDAEQALAKAYSAKHCLIFTQGATSVIQAALHALKRSGKAIAVDSIAHKSIYSAAELFGIDIIIYDVNQFVRIDLANIGTILITSPNYYGFNSDFQRVAELAHSHGIAVILDESHGSHYAFSSILPRQCYDNVDIIVNSMHKTLPCLTGAAIALTNDDNIRNNLHYSRSLIHSTSPNYMIMASVDKARAIMEKHGEKLYNQVQCDINTFKSLISTDFYRILDSDDFTRVTIALTNPIELAAYLTSYDIRPELVTSRHIVLIITPYNSMELNFLAHIMQDYTITYPDSRLDRNVDYNTRFMPINEAIPTSAQRRNDGINDMDTTANLSAMNNLCELGTRNNQSDNSAALLNATACAAQCEFVDINAALGRYCAANIGLYPPGSPVIRIGDRITNDIINYIIANNSRIFGITNGKIKVYQYCNIEPV